MASVKLPWDMEEEIMSRLPAQSLVRFRTVCKHWNGLFNDKKFASKHLSRSRPQIILLTESKKMYSIDVELSGGTIELRELPYDFPCQPMELRYTTITACDGLLFREFWKHGVAVWNPWLRQVGWIDFEDKKDFNVCGVGYDSSRPEKGYYKILGYFLCFRRVRATFEEGYDRVAIYECSSHTFKYIDVPPYKKCPSPDHLSVNGNLYWVSRNRETHECFIETFDFSMEMFKPFCLLPCPVGYDNNNVLVLSAFKEDRLSLLKQCYETRKIEIWETKIDREEDAVWIKLMTLPTTNLPKLLKMFCGISYFIFDNTLIICCFDIEIGAPCIYMVRGEDMLKKIPIDSEIVWFSHCLYLPSLISVPLVSHQV
ncbi:PREDICTED: F-box protein At3g17710-like [Camelina sativa]|uniref:F-box protein At3g17710-like n=1 Tax=Camelina sativa TaxID=90675 RepID=A0ABM0W587_CAMSA|nr:PREDICTED: F-box protein At3g17710-like [Camelina sativa]